MFEGSDQNSPPQGDANGGGTLLVDPVSDKAEVPEVETELVDEGAYRLRINWCGLRTGHPLMEDFIDHWTFREFGQLL